MNSLNSTKPIWARPSWQRIISLLLVLVILAPGCAQSPSRHDSSDAQTIRADSLGSSATTVAWEDSEDSSFTGLEENSGSLEKVRRHRSGRGARIAAVSVVLGVLVVVDLLLLPAYHRRHDCFPCCRTVIVYVD